MNNCTYKWIFFLDRKYSEGRKDHWFVSESNGLSYASKSYPPHPVAFIRVAWVAI